MLSIMKAHKIVAARGTAQLGLHLRTIGPAMPTSCPIHRVTK